MAKKTKNEAGKLRSFYRVETMGLDGRTIGGYVSAMMYLFSQILGVRPEEITEELLNSSQGKNEDFDEILITMGVLCDIPQPQEYVVNKKNYCLYQKDTFLGDEIYELRILDEILQNLTDYRYSLVVKEFKLRDDEIIYEDPYQVVVSEAVYKKHNKNKKCDELAMMTGLDEKDLEDEDDYWGEFFNDTAIENDLDMEIDYRKPLYEKPKKVSKKSKGGKEKMTYEKIVEKVKKALAKVDASGVKGHLAVQVDVYGEGEGAFYIEVKDGKVDVQPYEYFDHDLRIRCTGDEIVAIAEGKKKVIEEVAAENVEALRNVSRLEDFDLVFVRKQIKNKAAKKTKVSIPVEKAEKKVAKTEKKVTKKETKEDKKETKVAEKAEKKAKAETKIKADKKEVKEEKKEVKKEVKADKKAKKIEKTEKVTKAEKVEKKAKTEKKSETTRVEKPKKSQKAEKTE